MKINVQELKKWHESKVKQLEAIEYFQERLKANQDLLRQCSVYNTFPDIKKQVEHDIAIYKMCIIRLAERYFANNVEGVNN